MLLQIQTPGQGEKKKKVSQVVWGPKTFKNTCANQILKNYDWKIKLMKNVQTLGETWK